MKKPWLIIVIACCGWCAGVHAQEKNSAAADAESRSRDSVIMVRAKEYIGSLQLHDAAKEARLEAVVFTHLKAVRDWNNRHPASVVPEGIDPATGKRLSEMDRQIIANSAIPTAVHDSLMAGLHRDLTDAQVEAVLDKYTVGKVAFTMNGYRAIVPDLTDAEAVTILGFMKQAREQAVDFKNIKQVSAIFEIYKTKSEQYLNSNGRNWHQLYKAYVDKVKKK